jgi:divalent metal cation (Fe/Co/Zn/Cd) transporter
LKSPFTAFLSNIAVLLLNLFTALLTRSKAIFVEALRSFGDHLNGSLAYTDNKIALKREESFDPFGKTMYFNVFSSVIGLGVIGSLVAFDTIQTVMVLTSGSIATTQYLG